MLANLRRGDRALQVGDALLDQRIVAGIGNMWKAEALWHARVSPWQRVSELDDGELAGVVAAAAELMRRSVAGRREPHRVYRRAGRPCPRCAARIRSYPQGEQA